LTRLLTLIFLERLRIMSIALDDAHALVLEGLLFPLSLRRT